MWWERCRERWPPWDRRSAFSFPSTAKPSSKNLPAWCAASPFLLTTAIVSVPFSTAAYTTTFNITLSIIRRFSIAKDSTAPRWATTTIMPSASRCSAAPSSRARKILGVPDIFHCHDWQSALIPILLSSLYNDDPAFRNVPTVFTIHNIGYQGLFPPDTLPLLMLPWDLFTITKLEFYGKVNLLKGALVYSDFITTVSRKYAQEIQTSEYGFGLEGVLHSRANSVVGILNGVDYEQWNPEKDTYIAERYSADSLEKKAACKRDLLTQFGAAAARICRSSASSRASPRKRDST